LLKRSSSGPLAPLIDITSPANQSTVKEGANLRITVNASEANGAIANVYYYNGTTLIGMSTTPPFTYTWGNVPAGTLTLTAQATDVDGVSSASSPISVTATGDQGS
jgi:chitinase